MNWLKAAGSLGVVGLLSSPARQSKEGACENLHVCAWVNARTTLQAFRHHCSKEDVCAVEWGAGRGGGVQEIILFAFYRWSV